MVLLKGLEGTAAPMNPNDDLDVTGASGSTGQQKVASPPLSNDDTEKKPVDGKLGYLARLDDAGLSLASKLFLVGVIIAACFGFLKTRKSHTPRSRRAYA